MKKSWKVYVDPKRPNNIRVGDYVRVQNQSKTAYCGFVRAIGAEDITHRNGLVYVDWEDSYESWIAVELVKRIDPLTALAMQA